MYSFYPFSLVYKYTSYPVFSNFIRVEAKWDVNQDVSLGKKTEEIVVKESFA